MEDKLQKILNENEKVLWSGTPEAFDTLDNTYRTPYLLKTVIAALIAIVVSVFYVNYAANNGIPVKIGVIIFLAALAVMIAWPDLSDAKKLKTNVLYALTDSRMIVISGIEVAEVEYDKVDAFTFAEDADGHTSLLCGAEAMEEKPSSRRFSTLKGARFNDGKLSSFVMYALPDADKVRSIVAKHIAA